MVGTGSSDAEQTGINTLVAPVDNTPEIPRRRQPSTQASIPFQFIVGEKVNGSPTEFLVHKEAIAQLSKPLHTLTRGGCQNPKPDVQYGTM
ncbi:hypothetical protein DL95DRAFT_397100 [Leptodontidium sp. 2 PMI_412]|nr:hypothetical protein DL95DRAFT_398669 [Leptodontidium sp. 2 PMI_412]KAH9206233.1 hypothetical protein DL95DRAFT_397100 [Leptodontidium sp. 2 PMI_412]